MPAVVLFSGGQDSTTCLAWAMDKYGRHEVLPVCFDYGQKHHVELVQAHRITDLFGIHKPTVIKADALKQFGGAALTDVNIEVEAKASEDSGNSFAASHDLPSTFVPGRNLIFLSLAAAYGAQRGVYDLVTGVCAADESGYPDCRPEFIQSMEDTIRFALAEDTVNIEAPLLHLDKAGTFKLAEDLGVLDVIIDHTHTCYNGDRSIMHTWGAGCGECPACNERAKGYEAFLVGKGA